MRKAKWNKEELILEAKKYKSRGAFAQGSNGAYHAARKSGVLDEVCSHMVDLSKKWDKETILNQARKYKYFRDFVNNNRGAYDAARRLKIEKDLHRILDPIPQKWSFENTKKEAKKYKNRTAFARGSNGAYNKALEKGWLDEICSHMEILWEKKWDQKTILKEAKKYKYYSDFTKQSPGAYGAATRLGIIEKLHKVLLPQPEKWTFKNVKDEAKKYKHRVDFVRGNESAYQKARKEGWLDKVCSHMTILYNGYFHCVYVIKNERLKKAYVGITSQRFNERIVQHKKKNNPTKSKSISNLKDTEYEMLTDYIFTSEEIKKSIEMQYIEIMQKKGFEILNNLSFVGGVGYSKRKWTKELCAKEAIKYSTRWEFQKKSTNAYAAAKSHKYLDEICSHMDSPIQGQNNYWTKERCIEEVSKYKTKKDLSRGASYVYKKVLQNNWNDIFKHLQEPYIDSERDELGRYKKGISRKH